MSRLGHVGGGFLREMLRKKFAGAVAAEALAAKATETAGRIPTAGKLAAAEKARKSAADADAALASLFVPEDGEWRRRLTADEEKAAAERALLTRQVLSAFHREQETAELHAEEDVAAAETVQRRISAVAAQLPKALTALLDEMDPVMRRKREAAILAKIGWEDLPLCGASAEEVASIAKSRAAQYAKKFPASNPEYQTADHRRGRDESIQRRRLRKRARKVRGYIGQAVAGVGGADAETRKNYVTDYSVERHRDDVRQSHENMERLRILKPSEPKIQIPMLDAHKRKMEREAAKKALAHRRAAEAGGDYRRKGGVDHDHAARAVPFESDERGARGRGMGPDARARRADEGDAATASPDDEPVAGTGLSPVGLLDGAGATGRDGSPPP